MTKKKTETKKDEPIDFFVRLSNLIDEAINSGVDMDDVISDLKTTANDLEATERD